MGTVYASAEDVLKILKFSYFKKTTLFEDFLIFGSFLVVIALGVYQIRRYLNKERAKKVTFLKQDYQEKEKMTSDTLIANLQLLPNEYQLLERISGSTSFKKIYKIIDSVHRFEAMVEAFKRIENNSRVLSQIFHLRHKLGFHHKNIKAPFICSQMLTAGEHLECSVQVGHQDILFISPIVKISEKFLAIKPPTKKNNPVSLSRFPAIHCKFRCSDGVYEFKLPLIKQVFGEKNLIFLAHTHSIKKIVEREFERIEAAIDIELFLLADRQVHESTETLEELVNTGELPRLSGRIVDISLGGFRLITGYEQGAFGERAIVLFDIPEVNLKKKLQAQILEVFEKRKRLSFHLQFFHLNDIERLKLNKFLSRLKNQKTQQTKTNLSPVSQELENNIDLDPPR